MFLYEIYLHLKQNHYREDFRYFCLFITIANYVKSGILPTMEDYLMKLISLNIVLKQAIHETKTNTILDLGINTIRSIVLPVQSPEKEKNIIAAKIEKSPAFCNQLEKPISQHQTSAEQLMPTVLKVAFSYSSSSQATANTLEGAGA